MASPTTAESTGPPQLASQRTWHLALHTALCMLLFIVTALTTTATGALYMWNFQHGLEPLAAAADLIPIDWVLHHPRQLLAGWPFSVTLLGILLAHEFGHWFYCRRNNIEASWPYLLPAPTLSGTAGAVIRIRSRIPSRNALMDVGISGPIAGFVVAVPAVVAGLLFSRSADRASAGALIQLNTPLAMRLLHTAVKAFVPSLAPVTQMVWHPVLIAAWIGLLVTSLNLVPAGQLDGGHILYAISRKWHVWITHVVTVILLVAGVTMWAGWLLWGAILLLPAMRHSYVPALPVLDRGRIWLGVAGAVILVLTLTPAPFAGMSLIDFFR